MRLLQRRRDAEQQPPREAWGNGAGGDGDAGAGGGGGSNSSGGNRNVQFNIGVDVPKEDADRFAPPTPMPSRGTGLTPTDAVRKAHLLSGVGSDSNGGAGEGRTVQFNVNGDVPEDAERYAPPTPLPPGSRRSPQDARHSASALHDEVGTTVVQDGRAVKFAVNLDTVKEDQPRFAPPTPAPGRGNHADGNGSDSSAGISGGASGDGNGGGGGGDEGHVQFHLDLGTIEEDKPRFAPPTPVPDRLKPITEVQAQVEASALAKEVAAPAPADSGASAAAPPPQGLAATVVAKARNLASKVKRRGRAKHKAVFAESFDKRKGADAAPVKAPPKSEYIRSVRDVARVRVSHAARPCCVLTWHDACVTCVLSRRCERRCSTCSCSSS